MGRKSSASFRPASEIIFSRLRSDNEAVQNLDISGLVCNKSALTDTASVASRFLRVTGQDEDSVDGADYPGA